MADLEAICPECFIEDEEYFKECKQSMQALWLQERAYPLVRACEKHVKPTEVAELLVENYVRLNALGGIRTEAVEEVMNG